MDTPTPAETNELKKRSYELFTRLKGQTHDVVDYATIERAMQSIYELGKSAAPAPAVSAPSHNQDDHGNECSHPDCRAARFESAVSGQTPARVQRDVVMTAIRTAVALERINIGERAIDALTQAIVDAYTPPSAPVASAPKDETDDQSRVVGVPSDRPLGSTAASNEPKCDSCIHLTAFELSDELFTCPVVNIRIHRDSTKVFGCNQHEVK